MATSFNKNRPLVPSLLDRLVDSDPTNTREVAPVGPQALHLLKQSVRADLENLLNTRVRNTAWEPHLRELDHSLLDYGLPDFTGINLASDAGRLEFCRTLEAIIRKHEPRLTGVRVLPSTEAEPLDRTFHFTIHAILRIEPAPERVIFDSTVQPATGDFEVGGAHG